MPPADEKINLCKKAQGLERIMKKSLAFLLILVMVAVIAVPAIAVEDQAIEMSEVTVSTASVYIDSTTYPGYTALPYKTDDLLRYRNGVTNTNAAAHKLTGGSHVWVNHGQNPAYGTFALLGSHSNWGTSYETTPALAVAEELAVMSEDNNMKRAIKTTGEGVRAISFGFIPLEVLSNVTGIYYQWDEKVVSGGEVGKVQLAWADGEGLALDGVDTFELDHAGANDTANYYTFRLVVLNDGNVTISYEKVGDSTVNGSATETTTLLAEIPEGAKGIRLLVGAKGTSTATLERYYTNFVVGTISNNMAAYADTTADANNLSKDGNSFVIKFAAPITLASQANVKLYNGEGTEVEGSSYDWSTDNTELTVTAGDVFGTQSGYRVSTSKAVTESGNAIVNDVTVATEPYARTISVSEGAISGRLYDAFGNVIPSAATIQLDPVPEGEDESRTGTIVYTVYVENESDPLPNSVVPYIEAGSGILVYNPVYSGDFDGYTGVSSRYIKYIINGITEIPTTPFNVVVGGSNNAAQRYEYAVSFVKETLPEGGKVTSAITAGEDDLGAVDFLQPVTVTFSHDIIGQDTLAVTEDGSDYAAFTADWTDNKTVVLTPNTSWSRGAAYVISVDAQSSVLGTACEVDCTGLEFTSKVDTTFVAELTVEEGQDKEALNILKPVTITFPYEITTAGKATLVITENGAEFASSKYSAVWGTDGKSVVITPNPYWSIGASYAVSVAADASVLGSVCTVDSTALTFTADPEIPENASIVAFTAVNTTPVTFGVDVADDEKYVILGAEHYTDVTTINITATLTSMFANVEFNGSIFEADDATNIATGTIDLTGAISLDTAATLTVNNGFGGSEDYKIWVINGYKPLTTTYVYAQEDFTDLAVGDQPGKVTMPAGSAIKFAGSAGGSGSEGNIPSQTNNSNIYAKVALDGDNNVLEVFSNLSTGYAGWSTVPVPKSVTASAKSIIFSFDEKAFTGASAFQNGRFMFTPSTAEGQGVAGISNGDFQSSKDKITYPLQTGFKLSTRFSNGNPGENVVVQSGLNYLTTAAYDQWNSYQFTYTLNDNGNTLVNVKQKARNDGSWTSDVNSAPAVFNFKNPDYVKWTVNADASNNSHTKYMIDNFKIEIEKYVNDPVLTLSKGIYTEGADPIVVTFASIMPYTTMDKVAFTDKNGNEVASTMSWNDDCTELTIIPNAPLSEDMQYSLKGIGLQDFFGIEVILDEEVKVCPTGMPWYSSIALNIPTGETMTMGTDWDIELLGDGTYSIPTGWYNAVSSNPNVIKVVDNGTKYTLVPQMSGWAKVDVTTDNYAGVAYSKILYVSKVPVDVTTATGDVTHTGTISASTVGDVAVAVVANGAQIDVANSTVKMDDWNQTVTIIYNHTSDRDVKVNVTFTPDGVSSAATAPASTAQTVEVVLPKIAQGVEFGSVNVTLPTAIVPAAATADETYTLTIAPQGQVKVASVYFSDGIDLIDTNAATAANAQGLVEKMALTVGRAAEYNNLRVALREAIAEDLVALVSQDANSGDFADVPAVRTWFNDKLDQAVVDNGIVPSLPDQGTGAGPSSNNNSSSGSVTYAPGTFNEQYPVAGQTSKFTDLASVPWAKEAINELAKAGIVDGISDTEYAPLVLVKREEFVKLLVLAFDLYDPFLTSSFEDVEKGEWYDSYIASAVQAGLVKGISDTEFGVGDYITREQMATMLYRACVKCNVQLAKTKDVSFSDWDDISPYAQQAVEKLAGAGVINGIDGAFKPAEAANRAMAAQVIYLVWVKIQ